MWRHRSWVHKRGSATTKRRWCGEKVWRRKLMSKLLASITPEEHRERERERLRKGFVCCCCEAVAAINNSSSWPLGKLSMTWLKKAWRTKRATTKLKWVERQERKETCRSVGLSQGMFSWVGNNATITVFSFDLLEPRCRVHEPQIRKFQEQLFNFFSGQRKNRDVSMVIRMLHVTQRVKAMLHDATDLMEEWSSRWWKIISF